MDTADESVELQADPWGGQSIFYTGSWKSCITTAKTNWKSKSSHTFRWLGLINFSKREINKKKIKLITETEEGQNKMPKRIDSILFLLLFHIRIKKTGEKKSTKLFVFYIEIEVVSLLLTIHAAICFFARFGTSMLSISDDDDFEKPNTILDNSLNTI